MSDSPYDPSPETLDRIRDRAAAEAAAERVAGDTDLKAAVEKLKEVERAIEDAAKNAPAPPSSAVAYLPAVRPKPAPGHLTVPRIELRKPRQRTTMRALSAQPLVKLGFANVVNDGEGDVRAAPRWGRIALFAAPFVALAAVGIWRIADGRDRAGAAPAPSTDVGAPFENAAPIPVPTHSAAPTADPAPTAESHPTSEAATTSEPAPSASPTARQQTLPEKTSAPSQRSSSEKPAATGSRSSGGWKPEF